MSFSDDHASPAAPFSGDGAGDIFDAPDMVLQSPTTAERVVDTQSGFLVVVRRLEGRSTLSVRRRLGTPPSSSVVLTPDESLKLSRILSDSSAADAMEDAGAWTAAEDRSAAGARRGLSVLLTSAARGGRTKSSSPAALLALAGVGCTTLLLGGVLGYFFEHAAQSAAPPAAVAVKAPDPLDASQVDRFARRYVSDMLDFSPNTYRVSQVRAMAAMSPDLVDTYWTDTNFPLSKSQLRSLPHGSTVMIKKLSQNRLDDSSVAVDIFADLVTSGSKVTSPVHLRLKVAVDDGQLRVLEQKDLTAGTHQIR